MSWSTHITLFVVRNGVLTERRFMYISILHDAFDVLVAWLDIGAKRSHPSWRDWSTEDFWTDQTTVQYSAASNYSDWGTTVPEVDI